MGIEPTYLAWEASVLPLNYTRIFRTVFVILPPQTNICNSFFDMKAPSQIKAQRFRAAKICAAHEAYRSSRIFCKFHHSMVL